MNHAGDAAEQIVRMSLEGVEVAAKITGGAAKEIALLLLAALKSPEKGNGKIKLKGKERLTSMLKSGKALEIFSIKESDLKAFSQGAKQYGIVYCVLQNRNCPDGLCDVMVKADDAPKISRLVERFQFATVDKAKIESEIVADRAERAAEGAEFTPETEWRITEPEALDVNDTDKLLDDLLGTSDGRTAPEQRDAAPDDRTAGAMETQQQSEPVKAGTEVQGSRPLANNGPEVENSHPSEPTSDSRKNSERGISSSRPSVKEEIRAIKAGRRQKAKDAPSRDNPEAAKPKGRRLETNHTQPQGGKYKPKRLNQKGNR